MLPGLYLSSVGGSRFACRSPFWLQPGRTPRAAVIASAVPPAHMAAPAASAATAANPAATEVPAAMAAPGSPAPMAAPGSPAASAARQPSPVPPVRHADVERRGKRVHAAPERHRALWLFSFESVSGEVQKAVADLQETPDDQIWWRACEQSFSDDVEREYQDLHGECMLILQGRRGRRVTTIKVDLDTMLQQDEWGTVRKMRRVLVEEK